MNKTVIELTKSASRALSALYVKSVNAGDFTFSVFKRLNESLHGGTDIILWCWCVEYIGV
jgi:hypothetical protein